MDGTKCSELMGPLSTVTTGFDIILLTPSVTGSVSHSFL